MADLLADQGIFLISGLAAAVIPPVQLIGDILYIATNIPRRSSPG